MTVRIDIVATTLGAARPVEILDHDGGAAFTSFPCTRFGYPLSHSEFEKADGNHYSAFYAASIGKFPGANPAAMLFGIVAGQKEAFLYDSFGLAAHITSGKPKVSRKKIRIIATLDDIRSLLDDSPVTPLASISGKTVTCPACEAQPVRLKSFIDEWKKSGRAYVQMLRCAKCAAMPGERQWLGSALCRTCGSRVREDADKCKLCGEYPFSAQLP